MYLAGLSNVTSSPYFPPFLLASAAFPIFGIVRSGLRQSKEAQANSGDLKPLPTIGKILTVIHGLGSVGVRLALLGVAGYNLSSGNNLLNDTSLPSYPNMRNIQLLSILLDGTAYALVNSTMKALGNNFAPLGTREKATVVTDGPFSSVRHPLYLSMILSLASNVLIFWNWIPVYAFPAALLAVLFKIPLEERLILEDPQVADAYKKYRTTVRWKLIPYIY